MYPQSVAAVWVEVPIAMALLILGVLAASFGGHLEIVAPAIQAAPAQAPPMWPFLFITIACGAISGFHSLVSSGTSAKQVRSEEDSLFVGYGSMLMEGALATLVIIAVAAGIGMGYTTKSGETLTGVAAWTTHYSSWAAAAGLGSKISAFVDGAANMINTLGIPKQFTLAALALIVITLYLKTKGGLKWLVGGIPAVFMSVMTLWAAVMNQFKFGTQHNLLLQTINFVIVIIAVWIVIEGLIKFFSMDEASLEDAQPVTTS